MKGLCKRVGCKENRKGKGINKVRGGEMKGLCKGGGGKQNEKGTGIKATEKSTIRIQLTLNKNEYNRIIGNLAKIRQTIGSNP